MGCVESRRRPRQHMCIVAKSGAADGAERGELLEAPRRVWGEDWRAFFMVRIHPHFLLGAGEWCVAVASETFGHRGSAYSLTSKKKRESG